MPPRVVVRVAGADQVAAALKELSSPRLKETPAEGLLVPIAADADLGPLGAALQGPLPIRFLVLELAGEVSAAAASSFRAPSPARVVLLRRFGAGDGDALGEWGRTARQAGHFLALDAGAAAIEGLAGALKSVGEDRLIVTFSGGGAPAGEHAVGSYRRIAEALRSAGCRAPVWIRNTAATAVRGDNSFLSRLIEASLLTGSLLCDGVGDLVSIETESDPARAARLAYNVLQGAGARISKAEFVACPSCGRTLFDLQTTTQRIRAQTAHLKGVKIAIMGCIVNGPGEMADADFGYVGGAPGKINLYVGKQCVQYNIPQAEADARLIALIKEHKKWAEPEPAHA